MPRKVDTIIQAGDHIFDNSENQFLRSVKGAEVLIYDELIKILSNLNVSSGKLQTNDKTEAFLLSMDQKIFGALKKANYNESVLKYTQNFEKIAENTKDIQSALNGINITDEQIKPFMKVEIKNTVDKLAGTGLTKDFINPIRETLYRNIMIGADVTTVEKTIRDFVISTEGKDSTLLKTVSRTANDSLRQFDGLIQSKIQVDLGLNAIRYVGSLIADSRKQCVRWIEDNEGIILLEDLQDEIDWAFKYGSGMIKGTTPETFLLLRGGWSCRHRGITTMK